jgi:hypothetical protein
MTLTWIDNALQHLWKCCYGSGKVLITNLAVMRMYYETRSSLKSSSHIRNSFYGCQGRKFLRPWRVRVFFICFWICPFCCARDLLRCKGLVVVSGRVPPKYVIICSSSLLVLYHSKSCSDFKANLGVRGQWGEVLLCSFLSPHFVKKLHREV